MSPSPLSRSPFSTKPSFISTLGSLLLQPPRSAALRGGADQRRLEMKSLSGSIVASAPICIRTSALCIVSKMQVCLGAAVFDVSSVTLISLHALFPNMLTRMLTIRVQNVDDCVMLCEVFAPYCFCALLATSLTRPRSSWISCLASHAALPNTLQRHPHVLLFHF